MQNRRKRKKIVAITDTFIHVEINNNLQMLLKGSIAEIFVSLDPRIYRMHLIPIPRKTKDVFATM